MSIASSLEALAQAKADIADAIVAQGGTVGEGDGFADFATDIATIVTGYKLEVTEQTQATNVPIITYLPRDVSEIIGAILIYKSTSSQQSLQGQIFNARISDFAWGAYKVQGTGYLYTGTRYGKVGFPSSGDPYVTFGYPDGTSSSDTNPYKAGTYQIIIWGN